MPTDPAALADKAKMCLDLALYDFHGDDCDYCDGQNFEQCVVPGVVTAALRQYADPRTALALRVLAIVESPTEAACAAILAAAKGETP